MIPWGLAIPTWYSINTERLIYWLKSVKYLVEKIKQVWLADDTAAGGLLKDLFDVSATYREM